MVLRPESSASQVLGKRSTSKLHPKFRKSVSCIERRKKEETKQNKKGCSGQRIPAHTRDTHTAWSIKRLFNFPPGEGPREGPRTFANTNEFLTPNKDFYYQRGRTGWASQQVCQGQLASHMGKSNLILFTSHAQRWVPDGTKSLNAKSKTLKS